MPTTSQLRSIAIPFALLVCLAGLAGVLPAQNALSNPELDPPFFALGWRLFYGAELDWTGVDSDGCEGSGSGQLTSAPTDTGAEWAEAAQCVTVHPPSWPHGLHGSFSYQSGAATLAYIQFFYYSDSLCGLGGGSYLGSARAGSSRTLISTWTANSGVGCSGPHRLYCMSSAITIFWDGFESAGTEAWSAVLGGS